MTPSYPDAVSKSGGLPVVIPFIGDDEQIRQLTEKFDGFLFTGGPDVLPSYYGEESIGGPVYTCPERDRLELKVLEYARALGKPILGICRGLQLINVGLGGSLYQDLPTMYGTGTVHNQSAPRDTPTHEAVLTPGSPLADCLSSEKIQVNTFHHQGIKKLADGMVPMAYAPDGLIESFYDPSYSFLWAVQWHPEMLFDSDENSQRIFRAFIEAAKQQTG